MEGTTRARSSATEPIHKRDNEKVPIRAYFRAVIVRLVSKTPSENSASLGCDSQTVHHECVLALRRLCDVK